MTCHHIPSVRCPECSDDRPSMGYWPVVQPCGDCAALREENARLRAEAEEHFQEASHHADLQLKAEAEVKRLEGLILDWADAIPGATSPRYAAERVARADAALAVEAKRIRGER